MAAQIVPGETLTSVENDAISLTSTHSEGYSSDQEFLVERVLAEKKDKKNKPLYLISWSGYPEEKCTWEPKKNIQDPGILEDWQKRKGQEALGAKPAFDLANFDARIAEIERARGERHQRRNAKRRRLGIPVALSEESDLNGESSGEADEREFVKAQAKELPEDEPVLAGKAALPPQSQKDAQTKREVELELIDIEPSHNLPRDSQQDYESESSDLDRDFLVGNKKKAQQKALKAIRQRRSVQNGPRVSSGGEIPVTKPSTEVHVTAQSTIDTQLPEETRQQQKPLLNPAKSKRKLTTSSATTQSSLSRNAIHEKTATDIPGQPSTSKHRPAARGKGATRGGHLTNRNVFERREPSKKRPNIPETSSDQSKSQNLFPNWRLRRKAELAGRGMADAAPDLAALGGLFDPSDPSSFQPLKLATLRQLGSKTAGPAHRESGQSGATGEPTKEPDDTINEEPRNISGNSSRTNEPSDFSMPSRPAYVHERHGFNAVCHFWHYKGGCSRGVDCGYLHSDDPRLPIVPAPSTSSKGKSESEVERTRPYEASPPSSRRRSINEICFFWHKDGTCTKGTKCAFVHDNSAHFPVAYDPHIRTHPPPHYPSEHYRRNIEEDKQVQKEKEDREAKDGRDDKKIGSHAPPPGAPTPYDQSYTQLDRDNTLAGVAGVEPSTRPQCDARDPLRAMCYFWHAGSCARGLNCTFIHSSQSDLPIAPRPIDKSTVPCKFWPRGDCHMGERCLYIHSSKSQDPPISEADPTGPRKVVSFAVDDLETWSDKLAPVYQKKAPGPPEELKQFDTTCLFGPRNECIREEHNHSYETRPYESGHPKQTAPDIRYSKEQAANGDAGLNHLESFADSNLTNDLHPNSPPPLADQLQSPSNLEPSDVEIMMSINTKRGDNTTKLSMEEYRKKNADNQLLNDRVKEVIFGNDNPQSIVLDFGDIGAAAQQGWAESFSALRIFHFRQICTAQDFQALYGSLPRVVLWTGNLAANPADKLALDKADKFCQHLRLYSGGLISASADFTILIYPTIEEWKVLGPSVTFSPDDSLRYLIFQPSIDIRRLLAPKGETPQLFRKILAKSLHGLRYRQFLQPEKPGLVHHFYLMFPSGTNQTAAFFASWLRASDSRCKVYSSQTEGSWNFIISSPEIHTGVILIHESMVPHISELPSLYQLINPSIHNRTFTFWCIDDSSKQYPIFETADKSNLGQLSVIRIFPHGHAIFLTPSFLVAEPEKACYLIDWFRRKVKKVTPGTWKLVCAYDIRSYLLQLALDKSFERDQFYEQNHNKPAKDSWASERGLSYQACEARFKCYGMISDMLQEGIKDRIFEPYDLDASSNNATPIVYADESIDPDNEQCLISWFAGWSIRNLDRFRKYTVVGTNSLSSKRASRIKRPAEGFAGSETKTTTPISLGGASESGMTFDSSTDPTKEAMSAPSQNRNSPQNTLSDLEYGSVDMDTSPDSDGSIFTKIRAFYPESAPEILLFCSLTGCNIQTALGYLSNSNDNLQKAIQLFKTHNSREQMELMDIDGQILDMIASVKAEQTRQLPRLATGSATLINDRTPLSANSSARVLSPALGVTGTDIYSPTCNPSPASPVQFDGSRAQSPQLYGTNNSVTFKIKKDAKERLKSTNTGQKATNEEGNGSTHSEDRDVNRNRRIDNVLRSAASSRDTSRRGSYASPAAQSPVGEMMDVDSPQQELKNTVSNNPTTVDNISRNTSGTEVRYVSTTSWYRSLRPGGKEWEHIYIDAADNCLKVIGVK